MEKRIYERNPDTGEIRSRPFGDYRSESIKIESPINEKIRLKRIIKNLLNDDPSVEKLNKVIHFLNGGDAIH